jgi:hypothetical protein
VIATLLKQLAERQKVIPEPIYQMWKVHKHDDLPAIEQLSTAFIATCSHFDNCFIVLEALDECPLENLVPMTKLLRIMASAPCKVYISLADGKESLLRTVKDILPVQSMIRAEARMSDIESFVKWNLQGPAGLAQLVNYDDPITQAVKYRLLESKICTVLSENAKGRYVLNLLKP